MTGYLGIWEEHWQEVGCRRTPLRATRLDRHAHFWLATALWNLPASFWSCSEMLPLPAPIECHSAHFVEREHRPRLHGERCRTVRMTCV